MGWQAHLALRYRRADERCSVHDTHRGPLRVLKSLYPEGPGVCHNVLVHAPGGIVGGDVLDLDAELADGSHALLTTPGATRWYRSAGEAAHQSVTARLHGRSRLEWLPLETLVHDGALAHNTMRFELDAPAQMIGWDLLGLGLPASNQPFERGRYEQSISLPGRWLERGTIDGSDRRLLDSPLGWAGHRVLGTLWFAAGSALDGARREALLDAARALCDAHALKASAGSSAPNDALVVLRLLAPKVEPAMALFASVRDAWRRIAWELPACAPRIWRT